MAAKIVTGNSGGLDVEQHFTIAASCGDVANVHHRLAWRDFKRAVGHEVRALGSEWGGMRHGLAAAAKTFATVLGLR